MKLVNLLAELIFVVVIEIPAGSRNKYEIDHKTGDIRKNKLQDLHDVPEYELSEIKHFFEVYKTLEPGKQVHGGDWVGKAAAEEEIKNSYARFKEH